ncbi:outer membrane protein [Jiella sonneratiae]|uniref:Porin family protein n=1 Tax=Jiella sonneratiae TaxID=2816856 RepID=A0ABS3IZA8_9HYPH|nr:outer membrane protein [Jiella sonneratiae]MBO0902759.1 porin family protein [Jiella sonneratiae]
MIRRLMLTTSALIGMAGTAMAADVLVEPAAPAPYVSSVYDWSGLYIGINGGYAWGNVDTSTTIPAGSNINGVASALAIASGTGGFDSNGGLAGVQVGYNYQTGPYVVGVEADVDWSGLDDTRDSGIFTLGGFNARTTDDLDMNVLATVRGRLGYAMDRLLVYGTGGLAWSDATVRRNLDWSFADGCPPVGGGLQRCHVGEEDFDIGYTVGAGLEYAFTENFTAKVEYQYIDFGDEPFRTVNANIPNQPLDHEVSLDIHTIRVGLNYKFN